jgi:hypothetical protein
MNAANTNCSIGLELAISNSETSYLCIFVCTSGRVQPQLQRLGEAVASSACSATSNARAKATVLPKIHDLGAFAMLELTSKDRVQVPFPCPGPAPLQSFGMDARSMDNLDNSPSELNRSRGTAVPVSQ